MNAATALGARDGVAEDLRRFEARSKVTGEARYAADHTPPGTLHAVFVGAPVARGTLTGLDLDQALAVPGVVRIVTRDDLPELGEVEPPAAAVLNFPLQSDVIHHEGEPVAVILADSIEAAEAARPLVGVHCSAEPPVLPGAGELKPPPPSPVGEDFDKGDVDAALAEAAHTLSVTYVQPSRHHNPMETSGTLASWDGEDLTVWDSVQASSNLPPVFGPALGIEPEHLRIHAKHTGGGFGCKAFVWPHQLFAAAVARIVERPVKLHLRRSDQYSGTGYQPRVTQEIVLGADRGGILSALRHHVVNTTAIAEDYLEPATQSKAVYACPNIETRQQLEPVNANAPTALRAPMEGCGQWALEGAMNELAVATGIDPLELRLANYAETDPASGRPWSSKELRSAYDVGAELFGWRTRGERPRQDGPLRIGYGMATSSMGTARLMGSARVRVRADETATVETDVQDIGTGIQTVVRRVAAEGLGLPLAAIDVSWGDSRLPMTGALYGSAGTMHTGSAVALACRDALSQLGQDGTAELAIGESMREAGVEEIVGEGTFKPPGDLPMDLDGGEGDFAIRTFGACFFEVGVDPQLGTLHLRRAVGAYSAGRIMSPVTASAQMIGSLTWAWGKATMEESVLEPGHGRWLSKNLSSVHVPVSADVPGDIQVRFVDEADEEASPIGAKGIGELGATGADAAIADAVYDAVGIRFRELPITPPKVLDALAAAAAG